MMYVELAIHQMYPCHPISSGWFKKAISLIDPPMRLCHHARCFQPERVYNQSASRAKHEAVQHTWHVQSVVVLHLRRCTSSLVIVFLLNQRTGVWNPRLRYTQSRTFFSFRQLDIDYSRRCGVSGNPRNCPLALP